MYVGSVENVAEYAYPYTSSPFEDYNGTNSTVFAVSSDGHFFIVDPQNSDILEFSSITGDLLRTIDQPFPTAMALDSSNNLYIVTGGYIDVYPPPYTTFTSILAGVGGGIDTIAFDSKGDLVAGGISTNNVANIFVIKPPYASNDIVSTIYPYGAGYPISLTVDSNGNIYSANLYSLTEYSLPYSSTPTVTLQPYQPFHVGGISVDAIGP